MLKFLTIAGISFVVGLCGVTAFFTILTIGILLGEFFDDLGRKYGLKGSIIAFLIGLAIISLISAFILTIIGV